MASMLGDLEPDPAHTPDCTVDLKHIRIRGIVFDQPHVVALIATKAQREEGCDPQFDELFVDKLSGGEGPAKPDAFDESQHMGGADQQGLILEVRDVPTQSVD